MPALMQALGETRAPTLSASGEGLNGVEMLVFSLSAKRITEAHFCTGGASPPASLEELSALVRKEQLNGYGITAGLGADGERRLRGTALYHQSSLVNHECNPNMARQKLGILPLL